MTRWPQTWLPALCTHDTSGATISALITLSRGDAGRLSFSLLILASLTSACSKPRAAATPVLPTTAGWERLQSEVIVGDMAKFRLTLDWGGPMPAGLTWHTSYDLMQAHVGGLPIDPVHDPIVTRNGDLGELIELPTKNTGYLFVEAAGFLEVCQDRENGDCLQTPIKRAYALCGGGTANTVDFALDVVKSTTKMIVGERRPMQGTPMAGGEQPLTVQTSHQPVSSYVSENPRIATVDANGVIEALAPGFTRIQAFTSTGTLGQLGVDVTTGTAAPLSGAVLVTDHNTLLPIGSSSLEGRTPDTFAIEPNGAAAFLIDPDVASVVHDGVSAVRPLYLARWTGSGLGYERLNAWWEVTRAYFFDVGDDGSEVAGWIAERGTGLVVLDRPRGTEVGGWQRRRLPMRLDLATGAEREDGPQWPGDFRANNEKETISTLVSDAVIIGTYGDADGVWVAYGWGANHGSVPGDLPSWAEGSCVQIVRLAHVTPAAIAAEDISITFPDSRDCEHLVNGFSGGEEFERISVGPPEDGSDRPTVLVESKVHPMGGAFSRWQHLGGKWVAPYRGGVRYPNAPPAPDVHWNIDDPLSTQPLVPGVLGTAAVGPGGALWGGNGTYLVQRRGPYGNRVNDSVMGPSFGANPFTGRSIDYVAGGGRFGQLAVVARTAPPSASAGNDTWLYQEALIPAARADGGELDGVRLSSVEITPKYTALVVLADGTRVLMERPNRLMSGLSVSRSLGVGQPFSQESAVGGVEVPTDDPWVVWASGDRVFLAQGRASVTLWVSTNRAASFSAVATTVSATGSPVRAIASSARVTWLLTSTTLWRLDDGGGAMTVTPFAAGAWPGMLDTEERTLLVRDDVVYAITRATETATGHHHLITRRYSPSGAVLGATATRVEEQPILSSAAVTGSGVLLVPTREEVNETRKVLRSVNAGATWTTATPLPAYVFGLEFPTPVQLPDGRVAIVIDQRTSGHANLQPWSYDGQQAAVMTSADGVTWSEPRLVRGKGGRLQRAWLTAVDTNGDLLVHLGDAGTIAGLTIADCALEVSGQQLSNTTCLEGLFVRVPAP